MMLDDKCIECKWIYCPLSGACKLCHSQSDGYPINWEQTDRPIYCSCGHPFHDVNRIMFPVKCPRCDEPFNSLLQFQTHEEVTKYSPPIEKKLDKPSESCYTNENIEDAVKVVAERLTRLYPQCHYIGKGELPRAFDIDWENLVDEVIEIFNSLDFEIKKMEEDGL